MFYHSESLENINFEKVNLLKTTKISAFFEVYLNLKSINLNIDTSNIEYMDHLFADCENIEVLDLWHFDIFKVNNMNIIFKGLKKIKSLDISNFNITNCLNMSECLKNV